MNGGPCSGESRTSIYFSGSSCKKFNGVFDENA